MVSEAHSAPIESVELHLDLSVEGVDSTAPSVLLLDNAAAGRREGEERKGGGGNDEELNK